MKTKYQNYEDLKKTIDAESAEEYEKKVRELIKKLKI